MKPDNLTTQEYIDFLQRFILVHSYIYYELDSNVISDRLYDKKSKELVQYKNDYPELWKHFISRFTKIRADENSSYCLLCSA